MTHPIEQAAHRAVPAVQRHLEDGRPDPYHIALTVLAVVLNGFDSQTPAAKDVVEGLLECHRLMDEDHRAFCGHAMRAVDFVEASSHSAGSEPSNGWCPACLKFRPDPRSQREARCPYCGSEKLPVTKAARDLIAESDET